MLSLTRNSYLGPSMSICSQRFPSKWNKQWRREWIMSFYICGELTDKLMTHFKVRKVSVMSHGCQLNTTEQFRVQLTLFICRYTIRSHTQAGNASARSGADLWSFDLFTLSCCKIIYSQMFEIIKNKHESTSLARIYNEWCLTSSQAPIPNPCVSATNI